MKTRTLLIAIVFLLIGGNLQCQFLKKLGKSAEKAAERAVIRKTEQKVGKETEEAMDGMFDMDMGGLGGFGAQVDPSVLPASYSYEWRYTLRMEHEKGAMDMHYHLREDGTDFASTFEMEQQTPMGGMLMVMDGERGVMAILMDMGETKSGQVMAMTDEGIDVEVSEAEMGDNEFREIGTKQILGYTCHGYQMENEDMKMTMFIALDTPVSLNKVTGQDLKRMPKGFDPKWLDKIGENSLMMEMQMEHKKKKKHSATMTCVALEQEPLNIDISEYDFGFQKELQKSGQ